ncbi:MAG: hypothetical protein U0840_17940 [Gemmataceae bacterium]
MARFLALDWDQNQLHVVAAEIHKGVVRIKRVGLWRDTQLPNPAVAEELGKSLKERLRTLNIPPAPVLACVGRDRMIVKDIRFPAVPAAEEPAIVRFQTVKELTDAADDVVIDYVTAGGTPGGEQKAIALVIRKEQLSAYSLLCEAAGLKLAGLCPRVLGVAACLRKVLGTTVVTPAPTPPDGIIAVVNIGEKLAEISILRGETFLLTRAVPNGPNLAGEIRRNSAVHGGQLPNQPVVAVYVTGHGAAELRQRLGEHLEQPTYFFDPFAGNEAGEAAEGAAAGSGATDAGTGSTGEVSSLPVTTRGTFAGAMGLLHLQASANALPVNFVAPRQPRAVTNPNYRLIRLGVLIAVALFVGLFALGRVLHASWAADLDQLESQRAALEKQLNESRENGKRLKAIEEWDTVVWLDELYELTARIPDVNALRITNINAEPLTRNPKSRAVAKATLKGKLLSSSNPRRPLDQLVSQFNKEGFYSTEAPKVEKDEFTLVVYFERRSPSDYKALIKEEKAPARPSSSVSKSKEEEPEEKVGPSKEKYKEKEKEKEKEKDSKDPRSKSDRSSKSDKSGKSDRTEKKRSDAEED